MAKRGMDSAITQAAGAGNLAVTGDATGARLVMARPAPLTLRRAMQPMGGLLRVLVIQRQQLTLTKHKLILRLVLGVLMVLLSVPMGSVHLPAKHDWVRRGKRCDALRANNSGDDDDNDCVRRRCCNCWHNCINCI